MEPPRDVGVPRGRGVNVMQPLGFGKPGQTLKVLCLGAHSDDIEIGVGGGEIGGEGVAFDGDRFEG